MAWAIIALRPVQNTAACTDTSTNCASPVMQAPLVGHQRAGGALGGGVVPGLRHRDAHRLAVGVAVERHGAAHRGQRQVGGEVVGVRAGLAERGERDVDEIGPGGAQRLEAEAPGVHDAGTGVLEQEVGGGHEGQEVLADRGDRRGRARRCACPGCRRGTGGWPVPPARRRRGALRSVTREPPGGSTLTTSAPRPARMNVASSARPSVRSSTRYGASMEGASGTGCMIPRRRRGAPSRAPPGHS